MTDDIPDDLPIGAHVMSMGKLAALIGKHRTTIREWIADSCPVVSRGSNGDAVMMDLHEVLKWREAKIRSDERGRHKGKPGDLKKTDVGDQAKLADIDLKRQKLAMQAKILIHREPLEMAIRQGNGLARQSVMSLPEQIVQKLGGVVPRDKIAEIQKLTWDVCAAAMTSWSTEVSSAMQAAANRVIDLDDEEDEDDDGEA